MRTRVLSSTFRFLSFALVGAALMLASCGAITEEDLQKWSRNEEGLARISEMMKDNEVPFDIRVRAVQVLVENGWAASRTSSMTTRTRPSLPTLPRISSPSR